ncbi:exonuclease I [Actinobacillus equuli]|nr:exonuclease I [Actinobacillus equuli]
MLLPENAARLGIDRERCLENLKLLKANKSLVREKVTEILWKNGALSLLRMWKPRCMTAFSHQRIK